MSQRLLHSPFLMFAICISFFGLLLVIMLVSNPPLTQGILSWRKPVIGALFGSLCIAGIAAVFFPRHCSAALHFTRQRITTSHMHAGNANHPPSNGDFPTLQGHHPNCESFSAHVIQIHDKALCAACTGLLLGALVALAGTVIYFFHDWHITQNSYLMVSVGALGVGFGLLQLKFGCFVRLLLNVFFVLGAFLILVGIDGLTQSLFVDLFIVALTIFWLLTRILLSQWDHRRTCQICKTPCQISKTQKEGGD